jgi:acyl-CoA dehydrogenase
LHALWRAREVLAIEEVGPPAAGPGQVLIAVQAASLNFPDLLMVRGEYQVKPECPFVPGMECAGTVAAISAGVEGFAPGHAVIGFGGHDRGRRSAAMGRSMAWRPSQLFPYLKAYTMIPRTIFSPDHETFRDTARRFIAEKITPYHAQWERDGRTPRDLWLEAGRAGLLCCNVPEEYGGMGGDFLHSTILIEEMARAGATGPTFYLHSDIVAPYLVEFASEEQKHKWLPRMATGETIVGVAMTEPTGGSDLKDLKTSARREGDEFVIRGQKVFITNGHSADLLVVACKTAPEAGARGVSLILVETDRPGFERGKLLEKVGCKAQDTAELFFADVRVPVSNLLGVEGRGFSHLMSQLAQERLVQAIRAVASAEAAIEWTIAYTRDRKMFGHTLANFQNTQFVIADLHAQVLAQRVFVDRCVELHLRGEFDAMDAAAAKMITCELQGKVMDECLQLFGGWGYMWEFPIARAWVDARMTRIGGGAIEVMKHIIGRQLLEA